MSQDLIWDNHETTSPDYLDLSIDDVGACIELVYTPVRKDGARGSPKSIISDIIVPGNCLFALKLINSIMSIYIAN